jgi:hypothetical protein
MEHEQQQLIKLVADIFATDIMEIHCETAGDLMERSAEAGLTDDESQQQYPTLWQHFQRCTDCRREYQMMVDLVQLERADALATVTTIPPVPSAARQRTFWTTLGDTLQTVFTGFDTMAPANITRGESLGIEPVTLLMADGVTTVELDVEVNERDPQQRDLFCHVERAEDSAEIVAEESSLEAAPIWLQVGDNGSILAEQALDEFGDTLFRELTPGDYTLWLRLGDQAHAVRSLKIP